MKRQKTTILLLALAALPSIGAAQSRLSLSEAIQMASEKNGTVASAYYTYLSAHAKTLSSRGAFFPSLTPSYSYTSDRNQIVAGPHGSFQQTEGSTFAASANWKVLDNGNRQFNYLANRRSEDSQYFSARQTLRETITNVSTQYYEVLRARETLAQAQATYDRAKLIDDQTKLEAEVGKIAKIQTFQSQADLANAKVALIQARSATLTSAATLKSTIGLSASEPLPDLESFSVPDASGRPTNLSQSLDLGLKLRPDLISARKNIESLVFDQRLAELQAGVQLSLTTSFSESYSPDRLENRSAQLLLTYPLFDGGSSRQAARAASFTTKSARFALVQQERNAKAEIETAFQKLSVSADQLDAAQEAVNAAQKNFEAASAAQKEGAENIIDVSTAQVSLATAEANLINAKYNYYEADIEFKLATGAKLTGEPEMVAQEKSKPKSEIGMVQSPR